MSEPRVIDLTQALSDALNERDPAEVVVLNGVRYRRADLGIPVRLVIDDGQYVVLAKDDGSWNEVDTVLEPLIEKANAGEAMVRIFVPTDSEAGDSEEEA